MNLGIYLSSGDSISNMQKYGQADRFINFYLSQFSKKFNKIYIFSYENEAIKNLPKNIEVIPNKYNIHRYLYGLLIPFLNYEYMSKCDIFRAYHLLGTFPAIVSKIIFRKNFVFNYGYDYQEFAQIENKKLQLLLIKLIHPIACNLATRIIAVTKMVLKWTPEEKTVYIPNGVDVNIFKPARKVSHRKIRLLAVGRLETQKNYLNLIKALKGLDVEILIIGRGSLKELIISEAKKNNIRIEILERVDNRELPAYYNQADIFMIPSITEGPVKVLLEAMACGLPVVGANVNGIKEVLVDNVNGLFCNTSPQSIRKSLEKLLKDKILRKKLSVNARKHIVDNFNLDQLINKEINLMLTIKNG